MVETTTSGVKAKMIIHAVTINAHAIMGTRLSDMPIARILKKEMIVSKAPAMAAVSATLRPISQKSMPSPGE